MKFNRLILRITAFWTAFALSVIVASLFSDAILSCPSFHISGNMEASPARSAEKNIATVSTDNYAIYSAVFGQIRASETFLVGELVTDREWYNSQYVRSQYFNLSDHAINDYQLKNKEMRKLRNEFGLPYQVSLLTREEENLLFPKGEGGWDRFYRAYPKTRGIIYFSNVGFNKNKDEALVRVKVQSGYWDRRDTFYILKKIEGEWLVEEDSRSRIVE